MPSDKRQRQRENSRARQQALYAAQQRRRRRIQIGAVVLVVAAGAIALGIAMTGGKDTNTPSATATTLKPFKPVKGDPDTCPPANGTAKRFTQFDHAPKMCIDPAKKYTATIKTDVGTMTVDLNTAQAPTTVNNFVFLARNHFYDGIIFHRVINDFMDQTGDPQGNGRGGPGYTIPDEIPDGYQYTKGDLAMANTGQPGTGGSQFFIVTGSQGTSLPAQYTPFGHVTKGLAVANRINRDGSAGEGAPKVTHHIVSVTITEE